MFDEDVAALGFPGGSAVPCSALISTDHMSEVVFTGVAPVVLGRRLTMALCDM
ncbi:hypothetical protein [Streptomyces justiciae]|uniref:hypothetical protein n=1 Tax=Streptomyces justiciae TaxID=2780140 RepID=UPI00211863C4|nr:hypothetical protein [Streptomyces justiciae]MCW8382119.1 hypothetical protein [Streptomyces justiciae]